MINLEYCQAEVKSFQDSEKKYSKGLEITKLPKIFHKYYANIYTEIYIRRWYLSRPHTQRHYNIK